MSDDQLTLDGSPEPHPEVIARQDAAEARRRRDEAVERVGTNADDEWKRRALDAVRVLAESGQNFTSDDVWARVGSPREPRALGAVMRDAQRRELCVPTPDYRPSARPECHARPVRVWRGT